MPIFRSSVVSKKLTEWRDVIISILNPRSLKILIMFLLGMSVSRLFTLRKIIRQSSV